MICLTLPWPHKDLSPNARVCWQRRSRVVKQARRTAAALAIAAGWRSVTLPEGPLHLWFDFYPPTRRGIDDDNAMARCKPFRDGLADALGIDDKRFRSHPNVVDETRKGGMVVVRITGGLGR
jgi:crossover junction endodeoxyribonuclease RusA